MSQGKGLIYIFFGSDDFSMREALASLKSNLGDPETIAISTSRLGGERLTTGVLQTNVEAFPFFGDKRLVIIERLLERFEGKAKSASPKTSNKNLDADYSAFAAVLTTSPSTTISVLIDSEIKKTNPLFKALASKAEVREFAPVTQSQLPDWIKKRAAVAGTTISGEAAVALARLVGPNLWALSSELEKLSLFAAGRSIETADIDTAVAASREIGIFELVDAIMAGKRGPALRLLQNFLRDGQAPSYVIFMVARQLRLMVRTKSMLASGRSEQHIQDSLKLYGFALQRTMSQATTASLPRLRAFYRELLDADLAIKTSRFSDDLAINLLVAEACTR